MKTEIIQLAQKDFRVYRYRIGGYMLLGVSAILLSSLTSFSDNAAGNFVLFSGLLASVASTAFFMDELRSHSSILTASLPVTRRVIVGSRYLMSLVLSLMNITLFIIAYSVVSALVSPGLPQVVSLKSILLILLYALFHHGVFYYSYFRHHYFTTIVFNVFSMFLPLYLLIKVWRAKDTYQPWFEGQDVLMLMIAGGVTLAILAISYVTTLAHYERKDL